VTTKEQLVHAVIADPDADAPREAFAAWGVAHGDQQGELARIQLAEAHERRLGSPLEAHRRYLEAYDLIEQHEKEWAHEVLAIASQPQFFRGFVEVVTLDVPAFLSRAQDLYALAPVRGVIFVDAGPHMDALTASPQLSRLVYIKFYNRSDAAPLADAGLRTLLASPHLGKLRVLQLGWNEITAEGVKALAASTLGRQLRYVSLGNNPTEDPSEQFGIDAITLEINRDSIWLPPFGQALEAKHGELPWLHAPSMFRMFPPDLHDV
jgi:hypothetical protein